MSQEDWKMNDLLPCPFCGVEQGDHDEGVPFIQIEQVGRRYRGTCSNCGCKSGARYSEEEAIKAWNIRAAHIALGREEAQEEIQGLREQCQKERDHLKAEIAKRTARAEDAETIRDALEFPYSGIILEEKKRKALAALSRLSAGKVEPWVSVKDRLPEDSRHVLCCHGKSPAFVGYLWAGEWHDLDMGMRDPTHWMPLPPPPITPSGKE